MLEFLLRHHERTGSTEAAMATMRRLAPDLLITAKTQRWKQLVPLMLARG